MAKKITTLQNQFIKIKTKDLFLYFTFVLCIIGLLSFFFLSRAHTHSTHKSLLSPSSPQQSISTTRKTSPAPTQLPDRRINIPTRGEPPKYQQIGILTRDEGEDESRERNKDPKILQLYGRPTYRGSDIWNYYATHEGIEIPIYNNGVNCDRLRGCDEMYGGDNVDLNPYDSSYEIEIYKTLNNNVPPRYLG